MANKRDPDPILYDLRDPIVYKTGVMNDRIDINLRETVRLNFMGTWLKTQCEMFYHVVLFHPEKPNE